MANLWYILRFEIPFIHAFGVEGVRLAGSRMVLVEFSMTPLGKGESVSEYVSRSLDIIDKSGLPYRLTPMGTCIEGEWDQVMDVIRACHERMRQDCPRITTSIKVDYREGAEGRLESKMASVEKRLGRTLST